jgi:putative ABC transport system permease protein
MIPVLWRANWKSLGRHPWQVALTLLGIALGVAVVIAIDLANGSAYRAFTLATESVVGQATHEIIGGPDGLPEELYVHLRLDHQLYPSAPIVEGYVYLPNDNGKQLRLLGIDPFAERPFRNYLSGAGAESEVDIAALLAEPNTVTLERATAQRLGFKLGDQFTIYTGTRTTQLTVAGIFEGDALTREGLADLLIADIATAQEILDQVGKLSRIDLILLTGEAGAAQQARLKNLLPPGATLISASARSQAVIEMTRAFQLNLTALSLLALLVGSFIVFNTVTFLWLQRRRLIGLLRAIGVTRKQIFLLLLTESLGFGILGSVAGVLLGIGLGQGLLGLVSQTFNDLYFSVQIRDLSISLETLAKGIALGLGATLAATVIPALEVTNVPPGAGLRRSPLEIQARHWLKGATLIGGSLLTVGLLVLLMSSKSILLGFVGLTGLQVGSALLAPVLGTFLLALVRPLLGRSFGILGQLAARGIVASLSRTGVAMAALTLAIAATVGIGIMIDSFRLSVSQWLLTTLQADLYVAVPGSHTGPTNSSLDLSLIEDITSTPGVAAISTTHWVRLEDSKGFTDIVAFRPAPQSFASFQFTAGDPEEAWQAFIHKGAVLISEPYAYHHSLSPGSSLILHTDHGEHAFTVAGVYLSYGSDRGVVTIHRHTYERYWSDTKISGIGIYTNSGVDLELIRQTLLSKINPEHQVQISTNRAIRELSLQIFDRTFAITEVVRMLAGLVAFAGIFSALMALQLERTREFGILRAIGLTPRQLGWLVTGQTGLMGLVCGLLALPLGLASAIGLIYVINYRSFGWSMEFSVSSMRLSQGVMLALAAALLAGVYPAWRMAHTTPAAGLRDE